MPERKVLWIMTPAMLTMMFGLGVVPASGQDRPFQPASSGSQARHANWNSDGAPPPPSMWRGHGGTMWTDHYHRCRKRYGARYDPGTDMVRQGRRRERCQL